MSIFIKDVKPGDEVQGWMRLGLPLIKARNADGSAFRYVPLKPQTHNVPDAIVKFIGTVVKNDTHLKVLSLNVHQTSTRGQTSQGESCLALVPYSTLQILRVLSPYHYPAKSKNLIHPTNQQFAYVPYRTVIDVLIV